MLSKQLPPRTNRQLQCLRNATLRNTNAPPPQVINAARLRAHLGDDGRHDRRGPGAGPPHPPPPALARPPGGPTSSLKGHHHPSLDPAALGYHLQPTGALPIRLKRLRRNRICMRNGV